MIVVIVVAAFAPFRSNRMGFLHLLPVALVESLAVLGKIEAQVAVVALHQFRGCLWPKPIRLQVAFGIPGLEAFDEGFGIGAELPAFGDHRTQVQTVGKGGKPLTAPLMPIWPLQVIPTHAEAIGGLHDLLSPFAKG